jgi:hypothetical protein
MRLPVHQVCEGQPWPTELLIQPDTKVLQRDFCRQTRPKPAELMGPLPVQTPGMTERVGDRFDALPHSCPPAPPGLRPRRLARPLGRTQDLRPRGLPPPDLLLLSLTARVDHIRPQGWRPDTGPPWWRPAAQGKAGVGPRLVLGAGRPKATAGNAANGSDRQQEGEPGIPPQPLAPAALRHTRQPAGPASRGLSGRYAGAGEGLVGTVPCREALDERETTRHEGRVLLSYRALPGGPLRKRRQ